MKGYLLPFFLVAGICACIPNGKIEPAVSSKPLIQSVNPFIGSDGTGHTFPGATLPFGMMQLSPDTRVDGSWEGCSGYHYSDSYIYGFSHTHLSGTGVSDYGDILVMPVGEVIFHNGADGKKGYRQYFQHKDEKASPGYYAVMLDSIGVHAEFTVSSRSGRHRYTFPEGGKQMILIDLEHRDKVLDAGIWLHGDSLISGHRYSRAWAQDQRLYFDAKFSKPIQKVTFLNGASEGKKVLAVFEFDHLSGNTIEMDIAISAVDETGARANRLAEVHGKSFDQIKSEAENIWEKQLQKIIVETQNDDYRTIFYTALYHTMIAPNLYTDVDGRYRGMDMEIHQTDGFEYYTVFSLWDTYRAVHPLYTLIEQERTKDFIRTFIAKYEEGGIMPIWDLSANYTGCMIGYHAVPVIADAYLKGIRGYDEKKAFEAMKHSAMQDKLGLEAYKRLGYIPMEEESESVSKTLEYAYDDWTIARMAKAMNKEEDYEYFLKRAQYYKNVFDPESGFMRARFRNTWFSPFDPYEVNFNYTEANAWQYSLYTPQDFSGLIELMGGKDKLEAHLDALFSAAKETSGRQQADITGLIGQYAHGNEPSHHMAYLYNFVNKPNKTQEKVRNILTELYQNHPDGISGNEDCGQMSAWYVFSALGFYPVTPGSNEYIIGSPLVDKATIFLENGNTFTISAPGNGPENLYIASARLNGKSYNKSYISHTDIMKGGVLELRMVNSPSEWATGDDEIPVTSIHEHLITPAPYVAEGEVAFRESTRIVLGCAAKNATIFYKLNDSKYQEYTEPFNIGSNAILEVYSELNGVKSTIQTTHFYETDPTLTLTLGTMYANQYNGGGYHALIDGIRGSKDFRTGAWQGYQDTDLLATINLGTEKAIQSLRIHFLEEQRSWIFLPESVILEFSDDGERFRKLDHQQIDAKAPSENAEIHTVTFDLNGQKHQHLRVTAKNIGDLPEWHLGAPLKGKAWIFTDEIEINYTTP